MTLHISLIGRKDLSGEIYRQIRRAILARRLAPGDRLPPSRELARELAVSRMTVMVGYERLAGEGLVTSRVGGGTFVSELVGSDERPPTRHRSRGVLRPREIWDSISLATAFDHPAEFDFRTGIPDASLFPHRAWRRLIARALRSGEIAAGAYGHAAGHHGLRAAIARHFAISRGVRASADDITITAGTQQALDVIARALLAPGQKIAMEDPGYQPARGLFQALGLRVIGIPVDRKGLVVDALPQDVRAVYVTPSHQYPLGVAMTPRRRQALLAWADRNNAAIIEDDYDSEFKFAERPLDSLQALDTKGRVIYVGSFSKTLLPALRLGFLIAPQSLRSALHKAKFVSDWHTPTLAQTALAHLIEEGEFARHIRKANKVYRERHEILANAITRDFSDHLELIPSSTGLHLAALARTASAEQLTAVLRRAMDVGVVFQRLSAFGMSGSAQAGVVLGYGAIATGQIQEGLRRLRKCFDPVPSNASSSAAGAGQT
jgi:GntR family transcriptional regulator/MocR family aminotransferase